MSAIDGLIAALVGAPSFVHPDEWVPLIFGGRRPAMHENSSEHRIVQTIFNRYNEVSAILADQPEAYRPIFMVDDDGGIVARDWAVGFALGIGLRPEDWGKRILLTEHRDVLTPDPGLLRPQHRPPAGRVGRGKAPPASHRSHPNRPGCRRRTRHLQSLSRRRSAPATRPHPTLSSQAPIDQPWTIMSIGLRDWAHRC
jgi:Uncharacterised protein family (UPF0149)